MCPVEANEGPNGEKNLAGRALALRSTLLGVLVHPLGFTCRALKAEFSKSASTTQPADAELFAAAAPSLYNFHQTHRDGRPLAPQDNVAKSETKGPS